MKVVGAALMFLSLVCWANGFNITKILSAHSEYSRFNQLLSQTKLADEINRRQTITVLVVSNGHMGSLNGMSMAAIKNVLSLHVVLDFFDPQKLQAITDGTTLSTTLYQTTGNAPGNNGFVNITDLKDGKVGFGPAAKGSKLDSTFVKSVKQEGYNISVIEVSQLITTDVADADSPPTSSPPPPAAHAEEPSAKKDKPSASAKSDTSLAVATYVCAWPLILSVSAFEAWIMF